MRKSALGCFAVLAVLALAVSLLVNAFLSGLLFGGGAVSVRGPEALEESVVQPAATPVRHAAKIAQIDVAGMISGDAGRGGASMVDQVKRALQQAVADSAVKAIVLRIDSPGGEVTASDTIYQAVKKADASKPVIVFMDSMAASGGYYIACGARKIVATPNTWTGSIGVIMQSLGYGGVLEWAKLKMRIYKSGGMKDSLGGHRDPTPEEEAYLQKLVMQTYERFVKIVSDARGIPVETLKNGIADGRIITGADAVDLKLVDRTGYVEDAWQLAREAAGISDAEVVRYMQPQSLMGLLGLGMRTAAENAGPARVELDISDRLLPRLQPYRCYLLPAVTGQ